MPAAIIKKKVKIIPSDEKITVELEFNTLLLCTYRIQVKKPNSNKIVYDWQGDNTNDEDDKYTLGSGIENVGRTVWVFLTVIDQTGEGGDYEVSVLFKQNDQPVADGVLTTGEKILLPGVNKQDYVLVARIIE